MTYQAAYEAFGRHGDTASSEEWGVNPDRQQANTKDEDPTGLLNEGFRYRDLETGAFITRDPLGFVDGPNLYTYVVQNPWAKFDPMGLRGGPTPGQIRSRNAARARWEAAGGWMQVPAAAWSGTSRGLVNVSAGVGWLGATALSGYEQIIFGTNYSGEVATAIIAEARVKNEDISKIVADATGVSVDGAAFRSVEATIELVTEVTIPIATASRVNQLNKINGIPRGSLDNLSARRFYHQQLDEIAGKLDSTASMKD